LACFCEGAANALLEHGADLGVLREATFGLLREDDLAVGDDVELALRALLDLSLVPGLGVQLGRETRGPCIVPVSDRAVLNEDPCHGLKGTAG